MKSRILLGVLAAAAIGFLVVFLLNGSSGAGAFGQSAYAHTEAILAVGPRPAGSPELAKVRAYVSAELARHGWATREQRFEKFTPAGRVEFVNLIARFTGGDPATDDTWKRPVTGLLTAHIDSKKFTDRKFLGADDAASAVGLIITLAEDLAKDPARARHLELVFFDGEEAFGPNLTPTDGIYGSRHYAAGWVRRDAKPAFGILLDMVGHRDLRIAYPPDSPPELVAALTAAADAENATSRFRRASFPIIDDHLPLNNAGIPTIDIIGDFAASNWWHTARDNLDLIDPQSLDTSGRVVRRMLDALLRSE